MIRNWNMGRVTKTTRYRGGNPTTTTTETLLFRLEPARYL